MGAWLGRGVVGLTVVLLALSPRFVGGTMAGWGSGSLAGAGSLASAQVGISHTVASDCAGTARMSVVTCTPPLTPTTSPPATGPTDTITNTGSLAVAQSVTALSCGPVGLANTLSGSDPMLPRYGVTFGQPDPWSGTSAIGLHSGGYASDPVGTSGTGLLGLLQSNFAIGLWFRSTTTNGGGLISLALSPAADATAAGTPAIWMDTTGRIKAAVSGTLGPIVLTSAAAYNDGAWHLAVLSVATPVLLAVPTLTVDGAAVSGAGLTLLAGSAGYWHLGWADFTGLSGPASATFTGSVSGAFVNRTNALSAGQISALRAAASGSSYAAAVSGLNGASSLWMLGDSGYATVTLTAPAVLADPCSQVSLGVTFGSPAASIGPTPLTTLVGGGATSVPAPAVGASQTMVLATGRAAGYHAEIAGLHLYVPLTFSYAAGVWAQTLRWANDARAVVIA